MEVIPYSEKYFEQWNNFLLKAKNATFLFHRNYLEYHSDRFKDSSLLIIDNESIMALLPCSVKDYEAVSHGGLTYGGLVITNDARQEQVILYFKLILEYYYNLEINALVYKPLPSFYSTSQAFEYEYPLFLTKSVLFRLDTGSVLDLNQQINFQERKKRAIKKASGFGLKIEEGADFKIFWTNVLSPNLWERHQVKPVHSIEEITLLQTRFPENIVQYNVLDNEEVIAGTTLYITETTVHAQYISANGVGKEKGALDYLFDAIITKFKMNKRYLSFGVSTEDQGRTFNSGLTEWKEGFGARAWNNYFYKIPTSNHILLDKYLKATNIRN
ncbi:MAG: GNAT family N-acetyltransferase [Bacteroidota bacterium]|nr:GNAT family N-acetyltransferase [Bacteroidota bacterium]